MKQEEIVSNFYHTKEESELFNKRKGIIQFDDSLLKTCEPKLLSKIFSRIFPLDIQSGTGFSRLGNSNYYCISEEFDIVEPGELIPEYLLVIEPIVEARKDGPTPVNTNIINDYKISFNKL